MKKALGLFVCAFFLSGLSNAAPLSEKKASAQIKKAVAAFAPLAQSGISEYEVTPSRDVKTVLTELATVAKRIDEGETIHWVGDSNSAWEADSLNWGETDMKSAYSYLFSGNEDYEKGLKDEGDQAKLKAYLKSVEKAKAAFQLLLNTGVQFGVAPMGAIQCGVTFAALVIIDVHTGTVFVVSKEGSGC